MHLFRTIVVFLFIALHPVNAIPTRSIHDETITTQAQLALDICPQLKVNCVLNGEWRHPVGTLGKKRE